MLTICITGGSGSGKSTLARLIAEKIPDKKVILLPMDAYYKDHGHLSNPEKETFNFDHPDAFDFELFAEQLKLIKFHLPVERPVYSFMSCTRLPAKEMVDGGNIILIDGIFALMHDKIRKEIDLKVFLDVTEPNRLKRIIARDVAERGRTKDSVIERFYRQVKPMHDTYVEPSKKKSDVILDYNEDDVVPASNVIVNLIRNCIQLQESKLKSGSSFYSFN